MRRLNTAPWKIALAALFCVLGVAAVANHYWVSYRVDREVTQLRAIVALLAQADPAYAELKVVRSTHPKAWIFGTVQSSSRVDVVRQRVAESFGAEEAGRIVSQIRPSLPATGPSGG
jgi:hypothetical protein